jgi:hypothetical protein
MQLEEARAAAAEASDSVREFAAAASEARSQVCLVLACTLSLHWCCAGRFRHRVQL